MQTTFYCSWIISDKADQRGKQELKAQMKKTGGWIPPDNTRTTNIQQLSLSNNVMEWPDLLCLWLANPWLGLAMRSNSGLINPIFFFEQWWKHLKTNSHTGRLEQCELTVRHTNLSPKKIRAYGHYIWLCCCILWILLSRCWQWPSTRGLGASLTHNRPQSAAAAALVQKERWDILLLKQRRAGLGTPKVLSFIFTPKEFNLLVKAQWPQCVGVLHCHCRDHKTMQIHEHLCCLCFLGRALVDQMWSCARA